MAEFHIHGNLQYKTQAEGDACNAWLTNWIVQHQSEITSQSQSLRNDNIMDDGQGCIVELDFALDFATDVDNAHNLYAAEIGDAIYAGGVGTADCNSEFG